MRFKISSKLLPGTYLQAVCDTNSDRAYYWVCVLVKDVVYTLTRIIKSVVTGQSPVTLELRNTPGKNTNKPKVVHAWYITADAIHAYTRKDFFLFFSFTNIYFPASGQAVVTGVVPSSPRFLPSIFIAQKVQQSHCSSIFMECC